MAELKHNQVSASALIDVVVAMVIILVVFVLATSIFSGVLHSAPSIRQVYIRSIADSIINNSNDNMEQDELIVGDSLSFTKKIERFDGYSELFKITVLVDDHGRRAEVSSRIIKMKVDDE
jgi:hypothetical protein